MQVQNGISIHALLAESDLGSRSSSMYWQKISIHALLAESDFPPSILAQKVWISIHALLAESDQAHRKWQLAISDFYPRSPCGERPPSGSRYSQRGYFYPRSPCGERRFERLHTLFRHQFLSTLSLRRATLLKPRIANIKHDFYPRSPCGERPLDAGGNDLSKGDFYPRSPCGERRK